MPRRALASVSAFLFGGVQISLVALYPYIAERTNLGLAVVVACFSLGGLLFLWGSPFWAAKSDELGRERVLALGAAGLAASLLFLYLALHAPSSGFALAALLGARLLYGIFASSLAPVAQALQMDLGGSAGTKAMLNHSLSLSAGRVAGPLLLMLAGNRIQAWLTLALLAALVVAAWNALASVWARAPRKSEATAETGWVAMRGPLLLGLLFACYAEALNSSLGGALSAWHSLPATEAAQWMAKILLVTSLAVLAAQATARLLFAKDWGKLMAAGLCGLLSGSLLLASAPVGVWLWVSVALLSLGFGFLPPAYFAALHAREGGAKGAGWLASAHTLGYALGGGLAALALRTGLSHGPGLWVALALAVCGAAAPLLLTRQARAKEAACG
jgi:hypothetical protein